MKSEQSFRVPASPATDALTLTICLALATACGASDPAAGPGVVDAGGGRSSGGHPAGAAGVGPGAASGGGGAGGAGSGAGAGAGAGAGGAGAGAGGAGSGAGRAGAFGNAEGGAGNRGGGGSTGGASPAGHGGSAGQGPDSSDLLVPASGAWLGQYYGDASIAATTTKLGRTLPIHLNYWAWEDDWTKGETVADLAAGRIPLISWEPANIDFEDIVSGSLDATIKSRAAGAKALKEKFFLDFAAEMNGDEAWSGNNAKLYVDAYRHIHDLFVAAGATNVVWAWCPNVSDTDGTNSATLSYYPGDDYVDWTGVDGYNWGGSEWQSFHDVFKDIYPLLAGKKKPILIGEMASSETGGNKAEWLNAMIPSLKNDFPWIKGVVWFDVNKERDWRISSSAATEKAFRALAEDPFFSP